MVLDLGDHAARSAPRRGLILEAPIPDQRSVAGPAPWSSEQILDPPLQDVIGWQPDRVAHPGAFQGLVEPGHRECGIRPYHNRLPAPPLPINERQQDLVPSSGAVDIARSEFRGEAVSLAVEHEERVVADGLEVPVVRGLLLRPMDGALGAIDVERHASAGRSRRHVLNQVRVQARQSVVVPLLRQDLCLECTVDVSATLVSRRCARPASETSGPRPTVRLRWCPRTRPGGAR